MVKRALKKTYDNVTEVVYVLSRVGLFAIGVLAAVWVYVILLDEIFGDDAFFVPFVLLWILTAYIVLPRIHRLLTKLYIPNYFIGRTRTGDGIFGDPVNLALNGSKKQLRKAMLQSGWIEADPLTIKNALKTFKAGTFRTSYPSSPMSSLYLFSRMQDLAFQQPIGKSVHSRHHIRFWKTPNRWWLPGGFRADWLGAATYDKRVGISLFTGQVTHKVAEDTDTERDYVIKTLQDSKNINNLEIVEHYASGFHTRNGGGDRIVTDGAMPFITLK